MVLNYIWIGFFIVAFFVGVIKVLFTGNTLIFSEMMNSAFAMAKTGFELSIGLTGIMTFWLGIMKIGEKGGAINILAKIVSPFFSKLFPELPKKHPVHGSILMNLTANMLGLADAATPLGLKAMNELQELNTNKEVASNSQIMFMVLNASGLTLIPITIIVFRAQFGAANPADIFVPILITTFSAITTGIITVSIIQKINLFNKVILAYIGTFIILISALLYYFSTLSQEQISKISALTSNFILFSIIITFLLLALRKRINIYESFIDGAKEGFNVAIKIIPYLIAILVGIGVFRASGALDYLTDGIGWCFALFGLNTDFVDAIPVAIMKPLSGSGARGMMLENLKVFGADSFVGRLSCIFQGTSDTTFYIIALYFGSIGIKRTRYAIGAGLTADFIGMIVAVVIAYLFFH